MIFGKKSLFEDKIKSLQKEAINNSAILEELAGLEKYISETYISRVFYELLQNADDCKSTKFYCYLINSDLYVLNDGNIFNIEDLESLCRSASSNKQRGDSIGYRGIGFKSVAGICRSVSLISGTLEVCFSREKTQELFGREIKVPLLRVPHYGIISHPEKNEAKKLMMSGGFTTCFILHNVDIEKLDNDRKGITKDSIIFLRNINETLIKTNNSEVKIKLLRKVEYGKISESIYAIDKLIEEEIRAEMNQKRATISPSWSSSNKETFTRVWNYRNIQVSTDIKDGQPIRLKKNDAYAHAFLPMLTLTGLGARVNGDFSTDPSRLRINPDSHTRETLSEVADLIVELLRKLSKNEINDNELSLLEVLIPYDKSQVFSIAPAYISDILKSKIYSSTLEMSSFCLKPKWSNMSDYLILADASKKKELAFEQVSYNDYYNFFNKLEACELSILNVFNILTERRISQEGIFSLVEYIFTESQAFKQFNAISQDIILDSKILIDEEGNIVSGRDMKEKSAILNIEKTFITHIFNSADRMNSDFRPKSIEAIEFVRLCGLPQDVIPSDLLEPLIGRLLLSSNEYHMQIVKRFKSQNKVNKATDYMSIKANEKQLTINNGDLLVSYNSPKWRLAEKLGQEILESLGYQVLDVSKRNCGYDLEATSINRDLIYVEVKKISNFADEFRLTDNELFQAKQKGDSYFVLLIVQSGFALPSHYSMIQNFYSRFQNKVERRCVKHEMFCSGYEVSYDKLDIEA